MKKNVLRKGLVYAIVVLFVGVSIIPSTSSNISLSQDTLDNNMGCGFFNNITIVSIQPPAQEVEKGEYFDVGIYVEPSELIKGVCVDIYFDPTLIQANWIDAGDLFDPDPIPGPPPAGTIDNVNGKITNITDTESQGAVSDPGYFVYISFTAQQKLGTSPLDLQNALILDINDDLLPSTIIDGEVIIGGNTFYVGGNGSGNYTKIQDAIDNASDGDTVFVFDDSSPYYENVIIDKRINLIGENKDTTIIDGGGSGDVIMVDVDGWLSLSGFTIQNSGDEFFDDGGVDLHSGGCEISGNIFTNNVNGILAQDFYDRWVHCNIINDNLFIDNGCGIGFGDSYYNEVFDNQFINNDCGVIVWPLELPSLSPVATPAKPMYQANDEEYNNIYQNDFSGSTYYGIYIGISYVNVYENEISNNGCGIEMYAPYMMGVGYCNIHQNNITNNNYGIRMETWPKYSWIWGNNFFLNNFYNNRDGNLFMDHPGNYNNNWDDGSIGNYWDDYKGFDNDNDGTGDTPHKVDQGKDNYPIMTARGITSNPPDKPTIDGPIEGHVRREHTFYGNTNDPDEDNIRYVFDWGDNSITWTEYYLSGETGQAEHMWWLQGTYTVRVKARDRYGYESEWSDPLSVTMPRNRAVSNPFLFKILNRFMSCFPLLERLISR